VKLYLIEEVVLGKKADISSYKSAGMFSVG
jgi:hypothetical protein